MKQLLYSLRLLTRFRTYTLINLVGLVFSVACALIIVRYVHQEKTVDHYVPELERTFWTTAVQEGKKPSLTSSAKINPDKEYVDPLDDPRVERFTRIRTLHDKYVVSDNHRFNARVMGIDSLFMKIFPHPLVAGTDQLKSPAEAVITREMAERIFGTENPVGKTLTVSADKVKPVTVVGVVDKPATKSVLQFDVLVSAHEWRFFNYEVVQLYRAEDYKPLNVKNQKPMDLMGYFGGKVHYQLMPLKDYYLSTDIDFRGEFGMLRHGNAQSLTILMIVAALLLVVGIFNYVNLNTVMMLRRAREFGVKKVFGAQGRTVFGQLYTENFTFMLFALLFVWAFVEITRSVVLEWFDITVETDVTFDVTASLLLLLLLPLAVSLFPYFRYHRTAPIRSLRQIDASGHSVVSRTLFLFLQYLITLCLVITSIYFARQLHYVLHFDMGYRTKDIIQCSMIEPITYTSDISREELDKIAAESRAKGAIIRQRIDGSPLFTDWSSSPLPPGAYHTQAVATASNGEKAPISIMGCDRHYLDMLGFRLKEGRLWDDDKDSFGTYSLLLNETAIKALNITAINHTTVLLDEPLWIRMTPDGKLDKGDDPYAIVGVVEDFKTEHLSQAVAPFAFYYSDRSSSDLVAAIAPGKRQEAIAFLTDLYHELNGNGEFEYTFAEDDVAALYKDDQRSSRIYTTFAGIAICISCLGLFGLSLYDIRRRYREVALRKINGAGSRDIFTLLLRKYLYIFVAAFVVASVVSIFIIVRYMQSYYHHAPLSWWIFVAAAVLTAVISLGTLWWQISRAMRVNPAEAIKQP
jgi:ABC-type antimicrobial peptide transport system permease subunit